MYRSLGELTAYARQAFALFATPAPMPCNSNSSSNSTSASETDSSTLQHTRVLDRCGVECALYTLFGYCPPRSTLAVLYAGVDGDAHTTLRHDADGAHAHRGHRRHSTSSSMSSLCVDEASFVRFVAACGKHSDDLVAVAPDADASMRVYGGSSSAAYGQWSATTWRMYEALADKKGYCTLDDLLAADTPTPFATLVASSPQQRHDNNNDNDNCVSDDDDATTAVLTSAGDTPQRRALLAHVFDVLDRDGDGKARDDVDMPDSAIQTTDNVCIQQQQQRQQQQSCEGNDESDKVGDAAWSLSTRSRCAARARLYYHLQRPHRHWGIVAEPYMSPLHVVNLLLRHFGKRAATTSEAAAAVHDVTTYYTSLSQSAPHRTQAQQHLRTATTATATTATTTHDVVGKHSNDTYAAHDTQTQTQRQRRRVRRGLTQESVLALSQVSLTQQTTRTLTTDIQDALVLDVLQPLCAARGLQLSRLSTRQLRKLGHRLGAADVAPQRRALVVADRREPLFAVIVGVASRTRNDNNNNNNSNSNSNDGNDARRRAHATVSSSAAASCSDVTRPPYMQIICAAATPVPWRRLVRKKLARFPAKECVVAVVERVDDDDNKNDDNARTAADVAAATTLRSVAAQRPGKRARSPSLSSPTSASSQQQQLLLPLSSASSPSSSPSLPRTHSAPARNDDDNEGAGNDSVDDVVVSASSSSSLLALLQLPHDTRVAASASSSSSRDQRTTTVTTRAVVTNSNNSNNNDDMAATGVSSAQPLFAARDALVDDPLLHIPRVDVGGDARRQRRQQRGWLERLLLANTCHRAATYARLHEAATAASAQQRRHHRNGEHNDDDDDDGVDGGGVDVGDDDGDAHVAYYF